MLYGNIEVCKGDKVLIQENDKKSQLYGHDAQEGEVKGTYPAGILVVNKRGRKAFVNASHLTTGYVNIKNTKVKNHEKI